MTRYYRYDDVQLGPLAAVPCPACGGRRERLLGLDGEFRVVKCLDPGCGFVFVNPRPSPAQLRALYAHYYPEEAPAAEMWEREMGAIFRECREILCARAPAGKVLDVGCSYGHFLAGMEAVGWEAVGVEPSPRAAAEARRRLRGPVLEVDLETADIPPASFDAVVALYVLEHVADPRGFVAKMAALLRPGGLAIVRVPRTEPLMPLHRLLGRPLLQAPMHLNDFSPPAMRRLAQAAGFGDVAVRVGALRRSHDLFERLGALVLGGLARLGERASGGRVVLPFAGAYSYLLEKARG